MDFEEAIGILIEEESHLKLVLDTSTNNSTAFVAKKSDSKPAQGDSWVSQQVSNQTPKMASGNEPKDTMVCLLQEEGTH